MIAETRHRKCKQRFFELKIAELPKNKSEGNSALLLSKFCARRTNFYDSEPTKTYSSRSNSWNIFINSGADDLFSLR
jgi:hypothetical protein